MKKKLILFIIIVFLLISLGVFTLNKLINFKRNSNTSTNTITNDKTIFEINKIVFFSNCSAKSRIADNSNIIIENLYQYTDIALYINNDLENKNTFSNENTLKRVYIDNISFTDLPSIGNPALYYKSLNDFSKNELVNENIITDTLNFIISSDNDIDFTNPILYNNCANPITLSYINNNLKTDFGIDNSSSITYNGSLLKDCYITLGSLECTLNFDIHIVNNLDEEYICNTTIAIPLTNENNSLYDGTIIKEQNTNLKFNKIK